MELADATSVVEGPTEMVFDESTSANLDAHAGSKPVVQPRSQLPDVPDNLVKSDESCPLRVTFAKEIRYALTFAGLVCSSQVPVRCTGPCCSFVF